MTVKGFGSVGGDDGPRAPGLAIDCSGTSLERAVTGPSAAVSTGIVLGSGLSALARQVVREVVVPYAELPEYPSVTSVPGHAGELLIGELGGTRVAVFSGRLHLYQGVSAWDAAWTARLAAGLGCGALVVTNASGSVSDRVRPGQLMLVTDHLNLTGANPLTGWFGRDEASPFVPMRDAYDPGLQETAGAAAARLGIDLAEGVYAAVPGPTYETPAEVAALRLLGADVVGMSTVPEVIAARALGMRVLGLSFVANIAAGVGFSHTTVLDASEDAADDFGKLVVAILQSI